VTLGKGLPSPDVFHPKVTMLGGGGARLHLSHGHGPTRRERAMDIGMAKRQFTVEPIRDPVPAKHPAPVREPAPPAPPRATGRGVK
jgi:hypothetical protein